MSTPGAVNDLTRSRVWLASILNENSLECYLVIISTGECNLVIISTGECYLVTENVQTAHPGLVATIATNQHTYFGLVTMLDCTQFLRTEIAEQVLQT